MILVSGCTIAVLNVCQQSLTLPHISVILQINFVINCDSCGFSVKYIGLMTVLLVLLLVGRDLWQMLADSSLSDVSRLTTPCVLQSAGIIAPRASWFHCVVCIFGAWNASTIMY